ncbi:MAG TPA: hypothetical protein PK858_10835, partial [Saprospiraceae bacterium]|nr:hypothetical protein [Saprospiraceae bacterium]
MVQSFAVAGGVLLCFDVMLLKRMDGVGSFVPDDFSSCWVFPPWQGGNGIDVSWHVSRTSYHAERSEASEENACFGSTGPIFTLHKPQKVRQAA